MITISSETELRSALDSMTTSGGTIHIENTLVYVSSPLDIKRDNIHLIGEGWNSYLVYTGTGSMFRNPTGNLIRNCSLRNLQLARTNPTLLNTGIAIDGTKIEDLLIEDVLINQFDIGVLGAGIGLQVNRGQVWANNIGVKVTASRAVIRDLRVSNNKNRGIELASPSDHTLDACRVEGNSIGVYIQAAVASARIRDSRFENNKNIGVMVMPGATHIHLRDNQFQPYYAENGVTRYSCMVYDPGGAVERSGDIVL